jgi:hypothetical protein
MRTRNGEFVHRASVLPLTERYRQFTVHVKRSAFRGTQLDARVRLSLNGQWVKGKFLTSLDDNVVIDSTYENEGTQRYQSSLSFADLVFALIYLCKNPELILGCKIDDDVTNEVSGNQDSTVIRGRLSLSISLGQISATSRIDDGSKDSIRERKLDIKDLKSVPLGVSRLVADLCGRIGSKIRLVG